MTEKEWLMSRSTYDLLKQFPTVWDQRKLWLFGCACLRRQWHLLGDARTRKCVEVAEAFVDGLSSSDELDAVWQEFYEASEQDALSDPPYFNTFDAISNLSFYVDPTASLVVASEVAEGLACHIAAMERSRQNDLLLGFGDHVAADERSQQTDLLRDIFGNPFSPRAISSSWLNETVVAIATGIYQERAFDRMAILADALEEAGCNDADILIHCRAEQVHVRGCWLIDSLLNKN